VTLRPVAKCFAARREKLARHILSKVEDPLQFTADEERMGHFSQ
jgi:hypothetical protein